MRGAGLGRPLQMCRHPGGSPQPGLWPGGGVGLWEGSTCGGLRVASLSGCILCVLMGGGVGAGPVQNPQSGCSGVTAHLTDPEFTENYLGGGGTWAIRVSIVYVRLSLCLSVSICLALCPSESICPCVRPSVFVCVHLSLCLSVSICL